MNAVLVFKILHIIGFVSWFAGLFYLVRIFVYHKEALNKGEIEAEILSRQFIKMENRVYRIICNPGMMITWTFGLLMIHQLGVEWLEISKWIYVKIFFVFALTIYHLYCKRLMQNLEKGASEKSSMNFRYLNEIPTVLLAIIVSYAVFKNDTNPITLLLSILGLIAFIVAATVLYKKLRKDD